MRYRSGHLASKIDTDETIVNEDTAALALKRDPLAVFGADGTAS